jgi:hypothetical protein
MLGSVPPLALIILFDQSITISKLPFNISRANNVWLRGVYSFIMNSALAAAAITILLV